MVDSGRAGTLDVRTANQDAEVVRRLDELRPRLTQEQWDKVFGGQPPSVENHILIGPGGNFYLRPPGATIQQVPSGTAAAGDLFGPVLTPPEIAEIRRCSEQAQRDFIRNVYGVDEDKDDFPDFHTDRVKKALERHDGACLMPLEPSASAEMAAARSVLGVLYSRIHGRIVCVLTKVGDRRLASARHCAAVSRQGTDRLGDPISRQRARRYVVGDPENFSVLMLSDPRCSYAVAVIREFFGGDPIPGGREFSENEQSRDVVEFEVAEDIPGPTARIGSLVRDLDRLIVPGIHLHLAYDIKGLPALTGAAAGDGFAARLGPWESFMRVDGLGTCRVYRVVSANGCIIHSCQTEEGWSGAPLFVSAGGRVNLVGIHSGAVFEQSTCRAGLGPEITDHFKSAAPNVGILIAGQRLSSAAN